MKARVLALAFLLAAPAVAEGWLPEVASLAARTVDRHFTLLLALAAVAIACLFFAIDVLMVMNLRQDPDQLGTTPEGGRLNRSLAVLLPLLLVIVLLSIGMQGFVDASVAPTDAFSVEAHGDSSGWRFRYSKDVETETLHVPSNRPVRLTLHADESPMTLAIPAFRLRQNARPAASTQAWFEATQPGDYALLSSSTSLSRSAEIHSTVTVLSPPEFDSWLESKSDVLLTLPATEAGRVLVERKGCPVCHTTDGSPLTGPSFQGLMGRTSVLADGSSTIADADYVRRSILEPASQVVEGFQPVMPSFTGQLRDAEIDAIIAYLTTLSETTEAP